MRFSMKTKDTKKSRPALFQEKSESFWRHVDDALVLIMVLVSIMFIFMVLTGCTMSVNMMNSTGKAQDMVDTDQKADGEVSPTLSLPVIP